MGINISRSSLCNANMMSYCVVKCFPPEEGFAQKVVKVLPFEFWQPLFAFATAGCEALLLRIVLVGMLNYSTQKTDGDNILTHLCVNWRH